MGWKSWSAWLKGGIMVLSLVWIMDIIGYFIWNKIMYSHPYIFTVFFHILNSPLWIFINVFKSPRLYWSLYNASNAPTPTLLGFIIISIFYFAIGALIGFVVGKIKSK